LLFVRTVGHRELHSFPTRRSSDLWRGTCSRIVEKGILRLLQASGASPEDVVVAFGPAIRKCCYEVGTEVEAEFRKEGHEIERFRSEEHTSELQSRENLVCRLLLEK